MVVQEKQNVSLFVTSSKAQSLTRSLASLLLGDHIKPSSIPDNFSILSPKTANSLHPLCPRIISSILPQNEGKYKKRDIILTEVVPSKLQHKKATKNEEISGEVLKCQQLIGNDEIREEKKIVLRLLVSA